MRRKLNGQRKAIEFAIGDHEVRARLGALKNPQGLKILFFKIFHHAAALIEPRPHRSVLLLNTAQFFTQKRLINTSIKLLAEIQ